MKKFIFGYIVVATLLIIIGIAYIRYAAEEISRLRNNIEALSSEVRLYKTRHRESAASAVAIFPTTTSNSGYLALIFFKVVITFFE